MTAENPSALTFHFDVANIGHLFLQFRQTDAAAGRIHHMRHSILYDDFYGMNESRQRNANENKQIGVQVNTFAPFVSH
jgi:hypothetical protein